MQNPPAPPATRRPSRGRWYLGALVAALPTTWFAWDRGAFDPNDGQLVEAALAATEGDEAQVAAIARVYLEQSELKQTGWRRRHGPWRYSGHVYLDGMGTVMRRDPTSEAALQAATWIVEHDHGEAAEEAIGILGEHHLLSTPSAPLGQQPFDQALTILERQVDQHTDLESKALAQLALVNWHLFMEEVARDAATIMAMEPDERDEAALWLGGLRTVEYARSRDADTDHGAALDLLADLRDGMALHLPTKEAEKAAQLIRNEFKFGIGSVAPEISGTDLEGKEMRLSDFRGKVVVLDFWGHW